MVRCFIAAMLLCTAGAALAEGGSCPSGMYPIGGPGAQGCAPIPGYNDNSSYEPDAATPPAARPAPKIWEERWGAVANETGGSGFGGVAGMKSREQAQAAALNQCKSTATVAQGGCEVTISYYNQCVAYAWGNGHSSTYRAVDIPTARKSALESCNAQLERSGKCAVYYSDCSYAEAVQP